MVFQVAIRNRNTQETRFYYGTQVEVRPAIWGDNCFDVHIKPEVKDRFFPHRDDEWHMHRTDDPVYIKTGDIWNGTWFETTDLPDDYWNDRIATELINQQEEKNENIPIVEY